MSAHQWRIDLGRGPLVLDTSVTRYGVEQSEMPDVDGLGWHGGWPAHTSIENAVESLKFYEGGFRNSICRCASCQRRHEFRIRTYPPEPPEMFWRMERG